MQGIQSNSIRSSVSGGSITEMRSLPLQSYLLREAMTYTNPDADELPTIR